MPKMESVGFLTNNSNNYWVCFFFLMGSQGALLCGVGNQQACVELQSSHKLLEKQ